MKSRGSIRGAARLCGWALACTALVATSTVQALPETGERPRNTAAIETDRLTFVVIGHLRGDDNGETNPWLDAIVDDIRRLEPDLVFLTGDMIWGDFNAPVVDGEKVLRDWEQLDAALAPLGVPVYRVPGNHDINDPTTRRIYVERYGLPPERIDVGPVRFLLLNSTGSGEPSADGTMPVPRKTIGGVPLDGEQRVFLERELAGEPAPEHAFLFLHHIQWWRNDAPWWNEVHPLLVDTPVRAVFGGDYGPMKFSHLERDGIDYIQSSVEGMPSQEMLGLREPTRLLAQQFDTVVQVIVEGDDVRIEVRPVAEMVSGKFTPAFRKSLWDYSPPWQYRVRKILDRPGWLATRLGGLLAVFLAGWLAGRVVFVRRKR